MFLNSDRLLTTHTGSLPRPLDLVKLLRERDDRVALASEELDALIEAAVDDAVGKQIEIGIDIVNDGEMGKLGYASYVTHRLTGFSGSVRRASPAYLDDFPEFRDRLYAGGQLELVCSCCTGVVAPSSLTPLLRDIDRLQTAASRHGAGATFITAASPGIIASYQPNQFYATHDTYLVAIADAMREEYRTIIDAGPSLQIDCPDLAASRHTTFLELDDDAFVAQIERHVEILNYALRDMPAERMRLHVCWGNTESPHHRDIALQKILAVVFRARPQAIVLEAANPRHAHEWTVFRDVPLPDDKVLIPGVIDTTTNFVEHPELVAERLERFASVVGRERVIAGVDCGFESVAGASRVDARVAFAKLRSLVEGAEIASRRLWPGRRG